MKKKTPSRPSGPAVDAGPAAPNEQRGTSRRRLEIPLHLALILLVGIAAYANSFNAPMTFDDNASIVDNPVIKDLSSFLSGAGYAYNPRRFIGYLTIALNYRFGGLNVTGYHAVNLAVHLANALLVYALARITFLTPVFPRRTVTPDPSSVVPVRNSPFWQGGDVLPNVALFAALLFVAHPIQTQAVTYIVQRLASLTTLFYLAAVVCYVNARLAMTAMPEYLDPGAANREGDPATGRPETEQARTSVSYPRVLGWFAVSLVCTGLAMRTKEIAATLPLAIVLYEFSFFGAQGRKRLYLLAPVLLTLLVIPIGLTVSGKPVGELLSDVGAMTRETVDISRADYLLTQFSVIATYLRLLVLPVNQNLDYDYPVYHSFLAPRVLLSFLLICGLIGLAAWLYRKSARGGKETVAAPASGSIGRDMLTGPIRRLCAFGMAWFFLTLSVESSVIPIRDVIFEHRLYLPTAGIFLAFAAAAALLAGRVTGRVTAAAATVVILSLTAATSVRNAVWGDELLLWSDVLAKSPGKTRPYNNVGLLYKNRGELDRAIPCFEQAIAIKPDYQSYGNLGVAYYEKGRKADALILLERARELNPDYAPTYTNLGKIYLDADDTANALSNLENACRLAPDSPKANTNLGAAYLKAGNPAQAILHLKRALRGEPEALDARYNLGAACYLAGSVAAAVQELEGVLRVNPEHREARILLGTIRGDR